ncbi:DUF2194 domain-containing protein [Tenacibaculum sp. nBUS_03]|uniref:DUF2194 domain-containing protein n=1 Tax=Tenacibaculum sp. nBUS_03 TaxID=3395320 RepID=UPI003EBD5B97
MRERIKQLTKVCFVIILFFYSIYGFYSSANVNGKKIDSDDSNYFSKSSYFLNNKTPIVAFLQTENENENVLNHVKQLCDYTKIPFQIIKTKSINSKHFNLPPSLKTIYIHKTDKLSIKTIKKLIDFVAKGDSLIVTTLPEDFRLNYLLGLKKNTSLHSYNTSAKGIFITNNFTPGLNKLTIFKEMLHYGLNKKSFNDNVETILSADNEKNYPVILKNDIGLGKVIVFNTTLEISKYERGLLFPCLLSTIEGIPYPIANLNAIFIDDFPSPVYPFIKEPILSEYNISNQKFVKDVFWPDMLHLAKKYGIKYTTTIIFDYTENVEPPFSYKQWNSSREDFIPISHLITLDVLKQDHELGIHGYNHVSLLKKNWKAENIKIAFKTVKKHWDINNYDRLPASYIPPSNYIDKLGILSLNKGLPSIKYMCSLYTGKFVKGGDREFNPEPYLNKMFDFPRNTSGFYLNNFKKYLKESMYLYTGIWSHFIHPDDIYQVPDKSNLKSKGEFSYRNIKELNWKKTNTKNLPGLYHCFENLIKEHAENYPLSTFPDVRSGGDLVAKLRKSDFKHSSNKYLYKVDKLNESTKSQNWFTYITKENSKKLFKYLNKNNTPFSKIPILNGFLVNVKTLKGSISVPIVHSTSENYNLENIYLEYENYLSYKEIDNSSLKKIIKDLRSKIFDRKEVSQSLWNEYAKYCSWAKLEKQFWQDLEIYYYKYKNFEVAKLADKMSKTIWYPTKRSKLIWLERQIITAKNSKLRLGLLKQYVKNYNNNNNITQIRRKLNEIAKIQPSKENKMAHITSYLWNEDEAKPAMLNRLPTNKDYKSIAKELSWYFYENHQLNKALQWASFSKTVPIETQLYWLFDAKKYKELEEYFRNYKYSSKEEKFLAQKTMINLYLARNKFMDAWQIALSIPKSNKFYEEIRKKLNVFFLYQNRKTQKKLLNNNQYLYKNINDSISRFFMLENNDSYKLESVINTNRDKIVTFNKIFTYNHITKDNKTHSFSFSHSLLNEVSIKQPGNSNLFGLSYQFKNSSLFNKPHNYFSKIGLETDNNKYFFSLEVGTSYNKDNSLLSLNYKASPVRNNIALKKYLYMNTFSCYFEKNFKNKINATTYLESNYYTDHNKDITLSLSANYPFYTFNKNIIRFASEGTHSFGSANIDGNPYWMVKERSYLGGGVQYQLNTDIDKTFILMDAMYFYDSYSKSFTRFRAKINFPLKKYFNVSLNTELSQHDLFYSNSLSINMSYYLH